MRRAALLACLAIALAGASPPGCGRVRFLQIHDPSFDGLTATLEGARRTCARYDRLIAYAPSFDWRLPVCPNVWAYKDLYDGRAVRTAHPEWLLRDSAGNTLYIPWGCDPTCPQPAADVGDPGFRQWWIDTARREIVERGYRGIFVDDVNLRMQVGDSAGNPVAPRDDRTGRAMTTADWRRYVAEFAEAIRAAFPGVELAHNAVWWFTPADDPALLRQVAAADTYFVERGVADARNAAAVDDLLAFADVVHGRGRRIAWYQWSGAPVDREYALALYFAALAPGDRFHHQDGDRPEGWWTGYDVELGHALAARHGGDGLWRREFQRGFVVVNAPGNATATVPADGYRLDGRYAGTVTLAGGRGAVLLRVLD
jgi:hypothetical protein